MLQRDILFMEKPWDLATEVPQVGMATEKYFDLKMVQFHGRSKDLNDGETFFVTNNTVAKVGGGGDSGNFWTFSARRMFH